MIRSWRNAASRKVWEGETRRFRGLDHERAVALLMALHVAREVSDIAPYQGVRLHKLTGDRVGQHSITVNGRWQICFRFHRGDAYGVEIVDYHKG